VIAMLSPPLRITNPPKKRDWGKISQTEGDGRGPAPSRSPPNEDTRRHRGGPDELEKKEEKMSVGKLPSQAPVAVQSLHPRHRGAVDDIALPVLEGPGHHYQDVPLPDPHFLPDPARDPAQPGDAANTADPDLAGTHPQLRLPEDLLVPRLGETHPRISPSPVPGPCIFPDPSPVSGPSPSRFLPIHRCG